MFARTAVILGLLLGSFNSVDGEQIYPDELQVSIWRNQIFKGDALKMHEISLELHRLPREPWPEHVKALLLDIVERYYIDNKYLSWRDVIKSVNKCGEHRVEILEMVSWQEDVRFIPFLAQRLGAGHLGARALSAIGEPAFDAIVKGFYRDGWPSTQSGAALACEWMLEKELPFLQQANYRERMKAGLIYIAQSGDNYARARAIEALKYIGDKGIYTLINTMSRNDLYMINGRFPVRSRAQEALKFMRARGNGSP